VPDGSDHVSGPHADFVRVVTMCCSATRLR
jgi:hypothetical protein